MANFKLSKLDSLTIQKPLQPFLPKIYHYSVFSPLCWYNLNVVKGVGIELHKFWFGHDDHNRRVESTRREYTIDRPFMRFTLVENPFF